MLSCLWERFVQERKYVKNVSPATIEGYHKAWKAIGGLEKLDHEEFSVAVVRMRERGLSPVSVNVHVRAINAFLRWLWLEEQEPKLWRIPKQIEEKKVIQTFQPDQIRWLLDFKPKKLSEHRAFAMIVLFLDCGLRASEAVGLKREDVDLDNMLLKIRGKGRKERMVPMSYEGRKVLFRWLQRHTFSPVFATKTGTTISQRNAARDIAQVVRKVGLSNRANPHTFRHTFAVNYIRNGGDVFRLQRILGHISLEMTRRYVDLQTSDLSSVHNRCSVVGRK